MPKKGLAGLGVGRRPRRTDHGVDGVAGRGSEKGKEGIKTLTLRWVKMSQMSIKNLEPELRTVLPKSGTFLSFKRRGAVGLVGGGAEGDGADCRTEDTTAEAAAEAADDAAAPIT